MASRGAQRLYAWRQRCRSAGPSPPAEVAQEAGTLAQPVSWAGNGAGLTACPSLPCHSPAHPSPHLGLVAASRLRQLLVKGRHPKVDDFELHRQVSSSATSAAPTPARPCSKHMRQQLPCRGAGGCGPAPLTLTSTFGPSGSRLPSALQLKPGLGRTMPQLPCVLCRHQGCRWSSSSPPAAPSSTCCSPAPCLCSHTKQRSPGPRGLPPAPPACTTIAAGLPPACRAASSGRAPVEAS